MEIKTTVTNITHDDLVNLLCTATYVSSWLGCNFKKSDYYGTELENANDCREDKWAKILLAGKSIGVYDYESDGEAYGNLPHEWKADREVMRYTLTLKDIQAGIERIMNGCVDYIKPYVLDWCSDNGNLDQIEAEAIMQYIVFGEEIYG